MASPLHISVECLAFLTRETDAKRNRRSRNDNDVMACGRNSLARHVNSGFFDYDRNVIADSEEEKEELLVSCPECIKVMKQKGL